MLRTVGKKAGKTHEKSKEVGYLSIIKKPAGRLRRLSLH
jgi:hypothetical protein